MKKLVLFVFALFVGTASLMAQDAKQIEDSDYVILLDSKVFHYTADGVVLLKEDLKLHDGTVVKTDGTYVTDKKSLMLKDGQCIAMSGKLYRDQATLSKKLAKKLK